MGSTVKKAFAVLLCLSQPSWAAILPVANTYCASIDSQDNSCITDGSGGGANGGLIDTSGATLLVLAVECYNDRCSGISPTDNKSNTWTPLTLQGAATLSTIQIYYVNSATPNVGAGHKFTAGTSGGGTYSVMWVWAFSGTGASPLRVGTDIGTTASSSPTSLQAPSSIGQSGDVVISAISDNLGTGTSQSVDSSFTQSTCFGFVSSTHGAGCGGYKIVSGATQPTWSSLDGSDAAIVGAAFQAAGGAAAAAGFNKRAKLMKLEAF